MADSGLVGDSIARSGDASPDESGRREGDAAGSRWAAFGPDPWAAPLILGLAAAGLRLIAPGPPWTSFLSLAVGVGAVAAMVHRSRRSAGRSALAWMLFAMSVACASTTVILYPFAAVWPVGPIGDGLDLAAYVLGAVGAMVFARDFGGADPDAWLDASVVGVVLSLIVLEFVIASSGAVTLPGRPPMFPLAVAAVDAIVFTTLARFVIRPVASLSLSGVGLVIGLVLVIDATYYATGTDLIGRAPYEAMWMIAYGAWGAGAIHPDIAKLSRGVSPLPLTVDVQVRGAFRAIWMHAVGFVACVVVLLTDATDHAGAHMSLVLFGLLILVGLTCGRAARVVRRLADDTRKRVAVEQRLRESEERFRRLAEAAPVGIFVADAHGRTVYQNDALTAITGQPQGSTIDFSTSIHPDDRSGAHAIWTAAVRSGGPATTDARLVRPDNSTAWAQVRAVPLSGDDGRTSGWVGTVADVTELKEAIAAAQEREAFFDELIEQSPIGIGVYGLDGSLIGHNPAKRRIRERIGAPPAVVDVRTDPLMVRLAQADAIRRAYAGERAAGEPTAISAPLAGMTGDGEGERLWVRFRWYPLCDADGRPLAVISFVEDVTETVESFARERRVGDKLQEAQKLEALGVLAGGIAHDFNNLLVPIIGYVDLALADLPAGSPTVADLASARLAASRAAELARQMLAYSGRASFSIVPVALDDLLGEFGDLMARSIAKSGRLRYDFAPGLPPVLADATQLRQVALNLIVNASDALGDRRGVITLRAAMTTLAPDDPDIVPGGTAMPGDYVMLEVSDTGAGMDAATRSRIFDPFFSTKSVGRGLGLAAALGIVRGHGGAIRVRSVPGEGSTFEVLLRPSSQPARVVAPEAAQPVGRVAGGRVLLVDDEPSVRQIGRRILERVGLAVLEASDGPEALERFREDPDGFESVLLDLTLPSMDGLTVMRELRQIRPGLPVVLCSGWSADEVAGSVSSMPHTMFLQKPYQVQALVEALATVAH